MLNGFEFFLLLIGGFIFGVIARFIVPGDEKMSWSETTVVGVAGAGLGGMLLNLISGSGDLFEFGLGSVIAAVIGSVAILAAYITVRRRLGHNKEAVSIADLIAAGESDTVEFKQTARHNTYTGAKDPKLELVIAKTVAGFLNGDGGTLLIGVTDGGDVTGLSDDLQYMKAPDLDRYQLWITDHLQRCIGKTAVTGVSVSFPTVAGEAICQVVCEPADRPVFLDEPGGSRSADFYVRIGNSTRQLLTDEVLEYQQTRWG